MSSKTNIWNTRVHRLIDPDESARVLRAPAELDDIGELRIASYNVKNLFGEEPDTWSGRPDDATDPQQMRALGNMLVELDAEAVAFQEVQNERVLRKLFSSYVNRKLRERREDRFDAFVCIPARDPRGINVAFATRRAVRGTMSFHDYEFLDDAGKREAFSRDLLGVELFATPRYRLLVFVAHLKSMLGSDQGAPRRLRQAQEIRRLLEEPLLGGTPFIEQDMLLVGDMNDRPGSDPIDTLVGEGRPHTLRDVLEKEDPNFTYPTTSESPYPESRFDYLFASPTVVPRIAAQRIHRAEKASDASDHFPVSVDIVVPGGAG